MADKGDSNSQNSSSAGSDTEVPSETERPEAGIPSIPPIDTPANGEDNSAAIELFLEQVAAATTSSILSGLAREKEAAKDKERELKRAKRMIIPPECKCHLNGGEPCHTRFSVGELMDTRMHYMSISKKELDIAVLAKLECGIHLTKMTTRKKRRPTERKKHRTDFYHRGFRICNMMFVYLHGFSYKKLKALIQQYKTNGVRTRVHKNLKPKPADGEPKVKKKKLKPKIKTKDGKPRKPRIRKPKASKTGSSSGGDIKKETSGSSSSQLYPNLNPSKLPPPLPPPPHHSSYPVSFSMTTPSHAPQPSHFMPPQHSSPTSFPHAVGYNNGPVFPPHPMARHNPQLAHPSVTSSHSNPPLDFSNQRGGMPTNPPIDYSNQSSSPSSSMQQGFQGPNRPCMTYSVVHSVAF